MLAKNDFQQIKEIVGEEINPVKKQLDTVVIKIELVNKRVEGLEGKLGKVEENLERKIAQTQEETIDTLSELINTSYNLHEKRMKLLAASCEVSKRNSSEANNPTSLKLR